VQKLDLPCKNADSAATADVTAYGADDAENSEVDRAQQLLGAWLKVLTDRHADDTWVLEPQSEEAETAVQLR
jgi:hypothetical protein